MMRSTSPGASSSLSSSLPLPPRLTLAVGDVLGGRYRIDAVVRARSAGVQLAATDVMSGARVMVHVLVSATGWSESNPSGGLLGSPRDEARVLFLRGASRAKALEGQHIARVLDAGMTLEGHPWIAREHIASPTLAVHLREHREITTTDAVDITLAICEAIAEAHGKGILHSSLGPHAVHVGWASGALGGLENIKVTGLGTAAAEAVLALGAIGDVECILRSPEQLKHGSDVDERADIWAIGVLLHTMLAGASPFAADTPSGASLSVIIDEPPSLAGVPDELAEIVDRALAKDLAMRPRTVLELAEALIPFASQPNVIRERMVARCSAPSLSAMGIGMELPLPSESNPTLVVEATAYTALSLERSMLPPSPAPPPSTPSSSAVETPLTSSVTTADTIRERDTLREFIGMRPGEVAMLEELDVEPDVEPEPLRPPTLAPTVMTTAPAPTLQALASSDLPTRITRKPLSALLKETSSSFPRRRVFKILGLTTAAACIALMVLIGTEGARLARSPAAVAVTAPPTAPPPAEEPAVTSPIVTPSVETRSVEALPDDPRANAAAPAAKPRSAARTGPAAPIPTTSESQSLSLSPKPSSKPSGSGSSDDLRRFLDDRR